MTMNNTEMPKSSHRYTDDRPNYSGQNLHHSDFRNMDLHQADFEGTDCHTARFNGANLREVHMHQCDLQNADMRDAIIDCATLTEADCRFAQFDRANISHSDVGAADWRGVTGTGCVAHRTFFNGVCFITANMSQAILTQATLVWVRANDSDWNNANMAFADCRYADFTQCRMQYAQLSNANLQKAKFCYATLTTMDLRDADCRNTDFSFADLTGADCRGADLRGANFYCCDLTDTLLSGARIDGANFQDAALYAARMDDAVLERILDAYRIVPAAGGFIGWAAVDNHIVQLRIPADAARLGGMAGRTCRASWAEVIEIKAPTGEQRNSGVRDERGQFYQAGAYVFADDYNPDPYFENGRGIPFFMTREEAEAPIQSATS